MELQKEKGDQKKTADLAYKYGIPNSDANKHGKDGWMHDQNKKHDTNSNFKKDHEGPEGSSVDKSVNKNAERKNISSDGRKKVSEYADYWDIY